MLEKVCPYELMFYFVNQLLIYQHIKKLAFLVVLYLYYRPIITQKSDSLMYLTIITSMT